MVGVRLCVAFCRGLIAHIVHTVVTTMDTNANIHEYGLKFGSVRQPESCEATKGGCESQLPLNMLRLL